MPPPAALTETWVATEYITRATGRTFIKGRSKNGKHKNIFGMKKMIVKYCEDEGLEFDHVWQAHLAQSGQPPAKKQKKEAASGKVEEYIGNRQQAVYTYII